MKTTEVEFGTLLLVAAAPVQEEARVHVDTMQQRFMDLPPEELVNEVAAAPVQKQAPVPKDTKQVLAGMPQEEQVDKAVDALVQEHVQMPIDMERKLDVPQAESVDKHGEAPVQM